MSTSFALSHLPRSNRGPVKRWEIERVTNGETRDGRSPYVHPKLAAVVRFISFCAATLFLPLSYG